MIKPGSFRAAWFVCFSVLVMSFPVRASEPLSLSRLLMVAPVDNEGLDSGLLLQTDYRPRERESSSQVGGWGGFSLGWFFPDLGGFQGMTEERGLDGFGVPLRVWHGRGFVSINNFRIGGMGGGGAFHEVKKINDDKRWASLDIVYGGFSFGYLLPVTEQVGVFGGLTLGRGMAWMAADGDDLGDYWSQFETFDYTAPELGVSIKATNWFRVELAAQYKFLGLDTRGSSFYSAKGDKLVDLDSLSGPVYAVWLLFGYGG